MSPEGLFEIWEKWRHPTFYEGKGKICWIHTMEHHATGRNNALDVHTALWIDIKSTAHGKKTPFK